MYSGLHARAGYVRTDITDGRFIKPLFVFKGPQRSISNEKSKLSFRTITIILSIQLKFNSVYYLYSFK